MLHDRFPCILAQIMWFTPQPLNPPPVQKKSWFLALALPRATTSICIRCVTEGVPSFQKKPCDVRFWLRSRGGIHPTPDLEDLSSLKTHAKTICIPCLSSGGFWSRPLHQNTPANTVSGTFPRQSQSSSEPPYKISFIYPHKHCLLSINSFKTPTKCRKSQG